MERSLNIVSIPLRATLAPLERSRIFVGTMIGTALLCALLASWVPLQFSIVTVFIFAGPHNYVEFRYFLTRVPARFGKSRDFFLTAFAGLVILTIMYISLPGLYYFGAWSGNNWLTVIGVWNSLLLLWLATLTWLRGKQQKGRDWFWVWPVALLLLSLNWIAPGLFSLAIVYTHPLVALWFLERHLRRTRRQWLGAYHRCLALLPLLIFGMYLALANATDLSDDNGLAWRISRHAGAELLPGISSHLLVAVHVFLEMLHYLVWLLALPLLGATRGLIGFRQIPLVQHPRGFPGLISATLVFGAVLVATLWLGFAFDYATTRDLYFALAMAHVLAEAPFLLRTI